MHAHRPGARARDGARSAHLPRPGWWPTATGLLAAFCGAAATTAVAVALGGTRQQDGSLAAFAVVTAVTAARSVPLAAPGIGVIAWMFDNGFLVNRHAHLAWHGAADGIRLGVLAGAAIAGAGLGWAARAHRAPVSPPSPDAGGDRALPWRHGAVVDLGEIRDRQAAPGRDDGLRTAGHRRVPR